MSSLLRLEWLEGHHFLVRERLSRVINNHTNEKPMLKGTNECFVLFLTTRGAPASGSILRNYFWYALGKHIG